MASIVGLRHIVITPSRDESDLLPNLIESMKEQSIRPSQWIIVDHNSKDDTRRIVQEYMRENSWIEYLRVSDEKPRRRGSQIAKLFNDGINSSTIDWDFCSKIDADMVLPRDYFQRIFSEFEKSINLGIASGSCYVLEGRRKITETVSKDHTRGGLKTYRRDCYSSMGGISQVNGWDGIDNIVAQMKGWETRNFPEIEVRHMRRTGAYRGLSRGCFEAGQFAYSMRYLMPYIVARSIHRMFSKPPIIGGIAMFLGYVQAFLSRHPPACNSEVIAHLRKKQKKRIFFWSSRYN